MRGGHELAHRGLDAAWGRYDEARLGRDAQAACVAAVEVVVWAIAVEDLSRRQYDQQHGKDSWWAHRDAVDEHGWLAAARWVRNRGVHDAAQLLEVNEGGASWPVRWPLVFHELVWRAPEELDRWRPEADPHDNGLEEYRRVVGSPARLLLDGVRDLLRGPLAELSDEA